MSWPGLNLKYLNIVSTSRKNKAGTCSKCSALRLARGDSNDKYVVRHHCMTISIRHNLKLEHTGS